MSFKEVFNLSYAGLMSEIALLIFLGVFIAVAVRALTRQRSEMDSASRLPLEEGATQEQS